MHTRGVISAKVSYFKGAARVEYDPELANESSMAASLSAAGYSTGQKSAAAWAADGLCLAFVALLTWLMLTAPSPSPKAAQGMSFGAIFVLGLLTSPHCLGMCGGILLGQSAGSRSPAAASTLYNAGRIISYTAVGAAFGAAGRVITYSVSVRSMVFTMAGLAVTLIGLNLWGLIPALRALLPEQPSACRLPEQGKKRLAGKPFAIGILTGLMPCGSLYAMWLHAASTGSAAYGALSMLCFSLGTAPLMLLFGAFNMLFPRRWNKYLLRFGAVLVVSMGAKMLLSGLRSL